MRTFFIVIILLHGIIHMMGFLKVYVLAEISELSLLISPVLGALWLAAGIVFITSAILWFRNSNLRWITGIIGVILSQMLILAFWQDARFGTIPNLIILGVITAGFFQPSAPVEDAQSSMNSPKQRHNSNVKPGLIYLVFGLLLFVYDSASAQKTGNSSEWSVATSLTYPIAQIYQVHIGYKPNGNHEYIFGPAYQNFKSGSLTSNAMTLILGYRYYVWKNLNLEAELWPAYNPMYSDVTASTYRGVEIWGEIKIGYKFSFYRKLFIQPAPGIGFGIFRTNKPPKFNEDINSPIFAPQLIIGLKL